MTNGVLTTAHMLLSLTGNLTGNSSTVGSVQAAKVISWLTFIIGLPAIGVAIYTLKNMSKGGRKVPAHVMMLLVSDIISFFGRPTLDQASSSSSSSSPSSTTPILSSSNITDLLFYFGVVSNVSLMLFIAQERHLQVAYPQCVSSCATGRASRTMAMLKWGIPFGVLALAILQYNLWFAVALLAPFPLLLFFALDSCRALACSRSNRPTADRRRAVYGIGAIWANYSVLYLPFILSLLLEALAFKEVVEYLRLVSHLLLYLGPLVDPFLYIFMTQGPGEVLKALPCCGKRKETENMRDTVETVAGTVDTRL